MNKDSALENLQTIRTLMERSAVYRRALAPIMMFVGGFGIVAAGAGWFLNFSSQTSFIAYWLGVASVAIAGAFALVRRQALQSDEPFWSPPTRRVAQAMLPPLCVGLLLGVLGFLLCAQEPVADPPTGTQFDASQLIWLPPVWAILYGLALHAGGFFVSRGLRLFGWLYIAVGGAALAGLVLINPAHLPEFHWPASHWFMGGFFGVAQLAYGIYLKLTGEEQTAL
jgi:hypothetical protein